MSAPWPKPCHPCEKGKGGHSWSFGQIGNAWHTAYWNRTTGWWLARCCVGHRKMGRA